MSWGGGGGWGGGGVISQNEKDIEFVVFIETYSFI